MMSLVDNSTSSIFREEKLPGLKSRKLKKFSPIYALKIVDPRNGRLRAHYFEERNLFEISNAILEPSQGAIFTENGEFITDSTSWPNSHFLMSLPTKRRDFTVGETVNQATLLTSTSFYHWLIEDLPQSLWIAKMYPGTPILVDSYCPQYVKDVAASLQNPKIYVSGMVKVNKLLFVNKNKDSGWPCRYSVATLRNYEEFKLHILRSSGDKIYISRRNSSRSPSNENQLERALEEIGFQIIFLEQHSLFEQIEIISSARILVGVHGAGLTNMIWMKEESIVIDIVDAQYWTECYHRLAEICGLEYEVQIMQGTDKLEIEIAEVLTLIKGNLDRLGL